MSGIYETIRQKALDLEPQMRAVRQDLHTYAESGWFEVRTTSIIADRLTRLGYQVLTGADVCLAGSRMGLPPQEALDRHYALALEQGAIQPYAERAKDGFTGAIGILMTLVLNIPINVIVHDLTGIYALNSTLPWVGGVALVIISVVLTFIAGLIPSGLAARKDPVEALRTE